MEQPSLPSSTTDATTTLAELAAGSAVGVVFDSVMRKLEDASTSIQTNTDGEPINASETATSPKVAAEKYSRTTALLLRAQQLEQQLKNKAAAGRPDNMEGDFSNIDHRNNVGDAPLYEDEFSDEEENLDTELDADEALIVEETIRHAEQAKQNVRRYKKEADARRKRRLMMESAEADALSAKIQEAELRRQRTIEGHEDQRARSLRERLDKQRRARETRNRRREELFAAEKRIRRVKPKPLHKRMEDQYKHSVEMPELERRKKRLAEIHKRFTENSPDIPELDMRQRAHQALQRLSGERGHHKKKGRERTWMETRVWYHGQAKSRVLKEDQDKRTASSRKQTQLKMQLERKKAYAQWVKKVAPPQLDADKVGEMQSRVEKLRNPAPKKSQRDNAADRRPRRHRDRGQDKEQQDEDNEGRDGRNDRDDRSGRNGRNDRSNTTQQQQQQQQQQQLRRPKGEQRRQRPSAPTTDTSVMPPKRQGGSSSPPGGLSHPEDLSGRAAQLAARARELRNIVVEDNMDDDNMQHAKLQNMYLASMQSTLEAMANES